MDNDKPEVIYPRCPYCREDPLRLKRLRYDFPDGVLMETFFCGNLDCRMVISAQIVGLEKPKALK